MVHLIRAVAVYLIRAIAVYLIHALAVHLIHAMAVDLLSCDDFSSLFWVNGRKKLSEMTDIAYFYVGKKVR
ncbi:MAG: hypothetical protein AAFS00_17845 [Bacteroidota bacterium]